MGVIQLAVTGLLALRRRVQIALYLMSLCRVYCTVVLVSVLCWAPNYSRWTALRSMMARTFLLVQVVVRRVASGVMLTRFLAKLVVVLLSLTIKCIVVGVIPVVLQQLLRPPSKREELRP